MAMTTRTAATRNDDASAILVGIGAGLLFCLALATHALAFQ